jgi:chaperonin GroES
LFGPYAGNSTAKIKGEEVLIVSESEIFGVLEA